MFALGDMHGSSIIIISTSSSLMHQLLVWVFDLKCSFNLSARMTIQIYNIFNDLNKIFDLVFVSCDINISLNKCNIPISNCDIHALSRVALYWPVIVIQYHSDLWQRCSKLFSCTWLSKNILNSLCCLALPFNASSRHLRNFETFFIELPRTNYAHNEPLYWPLCEFNSLQTNMP